MNQKVLNVSRATLIIRATVTIKKTFRTKVEPPRIASFAPIIAPATLATARVKPICQRITPCNPKSIIAPKFVETFTTYAIADALKNAKPSPTIARTKKEPVPGPKMPS